MAKKKNKKRLMCLMSSGNTGYFKVFKKSRTYKGKISLMKFDPRLNKRVLFTEQRIKK